MLDLLFSDECDGCKHFRSAECYYCMRNSELYPDYPDNYEPCEVSAEDEY